MIRTIRKARGSEAAALSAIAQNAKASWGYPPAWLAAWTPDLTLSAEDLTRLVALVAVEGDPETGRLAGFAAMECDSSRATLEHFWILPEAHGRGIGRSLFDAIVAAAIAEQVKLIEIVSDPNAVGFYERMGAVADGSVAAAMPDAPTRVLPRMVYVPPARSSRLAAFGLP
jgi:ribosomal protein S18 acetylase RimI-like enzyme